jgi:hypothetical protein
MPKYLDIISQPVYLKKQKISICTDCIFHTDTGKFLALALKNESFALFKDILLWNPLTLKKISPKTSLQEVHEQLKKNISFVGNSVQDETGNVLGTCLDLSFSSSGNLEYIFVKNILLSFFLEPLIIPASAIMRITDEYIEVSSLFLKTPLHEV